MPKDFRENIFTQRGYEALDHVVANALKRGSNRSGEPHVDVTFPNGMIVEIESDDKQKIRAVIDISDSESADFCGDLVLSTLGKSLEKAKRMYEDAIGEPF